MQLPQVSDSSWLASTPERLIASANTVAPSSCADQHDGKGHSKIELDKTHVIGITSGVLPLCLCAALHALALERIKHGLVEVYPPNTASDESLWNAVVGAFQQHEQFIRVWLKSTPQTSEVRRAAPILAGLNYCLSRYPMPVMLSEFGANAGFNLLLDRCSLNAGRTLQPADDPIVTLSPDWMGVIPAQQPLKIIDRASVDINPLNPVDRLDYSRLLSYTWADQCARLDHTKVTCGCNSSV